MSFRTILVDPPWPESGGGKIKRGADRHYALLPVAQIVPAILASPVWKPAANAHLYLWSTNNHLRDALDIIDALGFRHITAITWAKMRFGLGQYFRGQTEHLLFAVRGDGMKVTRVSDRTLTTLLEADHPRDHRGQRIHSKKPPEAYDYIEARSHGPRAELFARATRLGWTSWGLELPPSAAAPPGKRAVER